MNIRLFFSVTGIVFGVIVLVISVVWGIYRLTKRKQEVDSFDGKIKHYMAYFVIALVLYSFILIYIIALRDNPGLSDIPIVGGGLVFFLITFICGALTELAYLILRVYRVCKDNRFENQPEVDKNGKKQGKLRRILKARTRVLDSMDKKRIDILVLIVMAVIMYMEHDRSSFWFCIVLVLNYFTWITFNPKEIWSNILNLFNMSLEVITTIILLVMTIGAYIIISTKFPTYKGECFIGYLVGIFFSIIFMVKMYYDVLPKYIFKNDKVEETSSK